MSTTVNTSTTPASWDTFISNHPSGHLLQSAAWGELKSGFGWEPLRLALVEGEQILAAALILFKRLPGASMAYVPRGPVLDWNNSSLLQELLAAIAAAGKERGAVFLKIEPNLPADPAFGERIAALEFGEGRTVQPRSSVIVDLDGDDETLLGRMKPKTRYNIRLAGRRGVTVRPAGGIEDVSLFYDMLQETAERDSFGVHTLEYYQAVYRLLPGALLLAEREGQVLAGLWAASCGPEAIYLYGASRSAGQQHMPTYLLQWEAMRWAREHGCGRYDLWGIPDTIADGQDEREEMEEKNVRDGLWGVYRFKQGFGGRLVRTVGAYDLVYRPILYKAYKGLVER